MVNISTSNKKPVPACLPACLPSCPPLLALTRTMCVSVKGGESSISAQSLARRCLHSADSFPSGHLGGAGGQGGRTGGNGRRRLVSEYVRSLEGSKQSAQKVSSRQDDPNPNLFGRRGRLVSSMEGNSWRRGWGRSRKRRAPAYHFRNLHTRSYGYKLLWGLSGVSFAGTKAEDLLYIKSWRRETCWPNVVVKHKGGGILGIMHGRSRMTMDPRKGGEYSFIIYHA